MTTHANEQGDDYPFLQGIEKPTTLLNKYDNDRTFNLKKPEKIKSGNSGIDISKRHEILSINTTGPEFKFGLETSLHASTCSSRRTHLGSDIMPYASVTKKVGNTELFLNVRVPDTRYAFREPDRNAISLGVRINL